MKRLIGIILSAMLIICAFSSVTLVADAAETSAKVTGQQSVAGNFNRNYSVTGNGASDMVNIAMAQNGRNQNSMGYTEAWCADFVSDCAQLAGQGAAIPFNGAVNSMYNAVINAGGARVGSAQAGDLVFFTNGNGYGHVGIATDGSHNISGNIYYLGASPSKVCVLENRYEGYSSWVFVRPNYRGAVPVNNGSNPTGCVDIIESTSAGTIHVRGWAYDRDSLGSSLTLHVYVGARAGEANPEVHAITANTYRPDVDAHPSHKGVGKYHGFDSVIKVSKSGNQGVYIYAINFGGGTTNPQIGEGRTNITPVYNPQGYLDAARSDSAGKLYVKGWAFDRDNVNTQLAIHIYVGGPAGSGTFIASIKANKKREDVNRVFPGVGNYHGFEETLTVNKYGTQSVYAYAINIGGGTDNPNLTLSPKTVNIIPQVQPITTVISTEKTNNPMKVIISTKTVKYSRLKNASITVKPITVKEAIGTVSYKKLSGNAKITINKNTGKAVVKKGLKKGTYRVKVKVTATGNYSYYSGNKTVTVKIIVK